jgi:Lar family restriction alleviation protein
MTELKSCPFCGNDLNTQDHMDTIYPRDREMTLWQVVCQRCSATMLGESKEHAIDSWNQREPELDSISDQEWDAAIIQIDQFFTDLRTTQTEDGELKFDQAQRWSLYDNAKPLD